LDYACVKHVGADADDRNLSTFLDTSPKKTVLFKNACASGTRAVRGLKAISASFPPISSESIVKRPWCDIASIWDAVMPQNGYQTSFL
jgi:hypothetical protein